MPAVFKTASWCVQSTFVGSNPTTPAKQIKQTKMRILILKHCDWHSIDFEDAGNNLVKDPVILKGIQDILDSDPYESSGLRTFPKFYILEFSDFHAQYYFKGKNPLIVFQKSIPFWLKGNLSFEKLTKEEALEDATVNKLKKFCKQNDIKHVFQTHAD